MGLINGIIELTGKAGRKLFGESAAPAVHAATHTAGSIAIKDFSKRELFLAGRDAAIDARNASRKGIFLRPTKTPAGLEGIAREGMTTKVSDQARKEFSKNLKDGYREEAIGKGYKGKEIDDYLTERESDYVTSRLKPYKEQIDGLSSKAAAAASGDIIGKRGLKAVAGTGGKLAGKTAMGVGLPVVGLAAITSATIPGATSAWLWAGGKVAEGVGSLISGVFNSNAEDPSKPEGNTLMAGLTGNEAGGNIFSNAFKTAVDFGDHLGLSHGISLAIAGLASFWMLKNVLGTIGSMTGASKIPFSCFAMTFGAIALTLQMASSSWPASAPSQDVTSSADLALKSSATAPALGLN